MWIRSTNLASESLGKVEIGEQHVGIIIFIFLSIIIIISGSSNAIYISSSRFVKVRATSNPSDENPVDVVFVQVQNKPLDVKQRLKCVLQCKAAHTASAIKGASNMFNEVRKSEPCHQKFR